MSEFITALYESSRRSTNEGDVLNDGVTRTFGREVIYIDSLQTMINKFGKKPKTLRVLEVILPRSFNNITYGSDRFPFRDTSGAGPIMEAILDKGYYGSAAEIAAELQTQLNATSSLVWTVTDNADATSTYSGSIKLKSAGNTFTISPGAASRNQAPTLAGVAVDEQLRSTDNAPTDEVDIPYNPEVPLEIYIRCSLLQGEDIGSNYNANPNNQAKGDNGVFVRTRFVGTSPILRLFTIYRKYGVIATIPLLGEELNDMVHFENYDSDGSLINIENSNLENIKLVFAITNKWGLPMDPHGEWGLVIEWGFENREDARRTLVTQV